MGTKSKTRVVVSVDGVDRELFSIRERRGGDLLVAVKHGMEFDFGLGENYQPIYEQRFSVHRSPLSPGFTLKQTLMAGMNTHTTAAWVLPGREGLRWPIFGMRCPTLAKERYVSGIRAKDTPVRLPSYNPLQYTLAYMLVVTSCGAPDPRTFENPTASITIRCGDFDLHVWYLYMAAPSLEQGDILVYATSAPRTDNTPHYTITPIEGRSLARERLHEIGSQSFESFSRSYAIRFERMIDKSGIVVSSEDRNLIDMRSQMWTRVPV